MQFFMKHLYVLMSWPEDMDMLKIKIFSFVFVFCSTNLSYFMIIHIFKDKHKVAGDINSLNLLVWLCHVYAPAELRLHCGHRSFCFVMCWL